MVSFRNAESVSFPRLFNISSRKKGALKVLGMPYEGMSKKESPFHIVCPEAGESEAPVDPYIHLIPMKPKDSRFIVLQWGPIGLIPE